jgi:hypothetical protein
VEDARKYGVDVLSTREPGQKRYWQAVEVLHLTPEENKGRRNVYVDVVDINGTPLRDGQVSWRWEGQRPDEIAKPAPLTKEGPNETGMADVPLEPGMVASIWLEPEPSDRVTGLSTDHPQELGANGEIWNGPGHHSFYVKFQEVRLTDPPTPPLPNPPRPPKVEVLELYQDTTVHVITHDHTLIVTVVREDVGG